MVKYLFSFYTRNINKFEWFYKNRIIVYTFGIMVLVFMQGCSNESRYMNTENIWGADFIIPQDKLPKDWILVPDSDMPLIGETSWWDKNPQIFEGEKLEEVRNDISEKRQPTKAIKFLAVAYQTKKVYGNRIVLFASQFLNQEDAQVEFNILSETIDEKSGYIGYARRYENTYVYIYLEQDCPNRDFFLMFFKENTKE